VSVYVPDWLQDTFDRAQRDLERVPNESLPSWLRHVEGSDLRSSQPHVMPRHSEDSAGRSGV